MAYTAAQSEYTGPRSLPVRVKNPDGPAAQWSEPLDEQSLHDLLTAVHAWEPVNWDKVYDDLAAVLNEEISHHAAGPSSRGRPGFTAPAHDETEEVAQRFRGALKQLVNRGLRDNAHKHPNIAGLIEDARTLSFEDLPGDEREALMFLRKLGRTTQELAEHLEEAGLVVGLVEC